MLTIQEALNFYNKSRFYSGPIEKYAMSSKGIVLIVKATQEDIFKGRCVYFLVDRDGRITPTNPILSDVNKNDVRNL